MKILILTESIAGSGHTKAAHNLEKGITSIYPHALVKVDTSLTKVSPFLEKWTSKMYMNTIHHASPIWGWAYEREKEWSRIGKGMLRKFISMRLEPFIRSESPDIVVSTHAFCLGGLADLKRKLDNPFLLGAAPTDYCINQFWVYPEVDYYFVGAQKIKSILVEQYSLSSDKVYVTGIPIDPKFTSEFDRFNFRKGYNIPDNASLVLISGGGLGLAPYFEILETLACIKQPLYVVVFTGTNQMIRGRLDSFRSDFPHPLLLLDYVENMNEWMKAADLLIGKPGGLTVSEAMAAGLPLIIFKPIPGQEERNSRFLMECEVALRAHNKEELEEAVVRFCTQPILLKHMKTRLADLGKPAAAYEVGKILFSNKYQ